jgi:serine protease Do
MINEVAISRHTGTETACTMKIPDRVRLRAGFGKFVAHAMCGTLTVLFAHSPAPADIEPEQSIAEPTRTVVKLFGAGVGNLDSYGSGTLVSADGHVVTVWNHLINTGYLTAVTADGKRFQTDVIGTSASHDLAVLQLRHDAGERFSFVDLSTALKPETGSQVFAFSNMFHVATGNEAVSVVHGIISAEAELSAGLGRWNLPVQSSVLILDAITNNSGAAGGLLADVYGNPVGLLGRELRHTESGTWVNYAVPFETLNPVIETILKGDTVKQEPDTGTKPSLSDRQLTSVWGMTLLPEVVRESPAFIDRVIPDSPAARAGLQRGDLVVLINDDVIQTSRKLRTLLADIRSGLRVSITVNRNDALTLVEMRVP